MSSGLEYRQSGISMSDHDFIEEHIATRGQETSVRLSAVHPVQNEITTNVGTRGGPAAAYR